MADRIAVMKDGRILQCDRPAAIYDRPLHLDVATFIGTPRMATFEAAAIAGGGVPQDAVTIACRPEHIGLAEPGTEGDVAATVSHVEHLGHESFVHVEAEGATAPVVVRRPTGERTRRVGARVALRLDPERLHAFDRDGRRIERSVASHRANMTDERPVELVHG